MSTARIDPTGTQVQLRREGPNGEVTAQLSEVGASLRHLTVGGVDIVPPYPAGRMAPSCSGVVLVPWPNRIRDGIWTQRGETRQLAVTEPAKGTAIHGLLRFAPYDIEQTADAAVLSATVFPQVGYPFALETSVQYQLTDDGIEVTHTIRNIGEGDAPVAIGTHPFFTIGDADTAELVLTVPAATWFEVDERLLPLVESEVSGDRDLRGGQRLADAHFDTAFGQLARDEDGLVRSTLRAPDGRTVTLWQDASFNWVQVYTTTAYPGVDHAVAVEPMTAPIDAFNSGDGLVWLAPGEDFMARWGVTFTR
ncbi:MAG: aldose 1-epimerase family protein [Microbacterium sp.]